MQKIIFISWRTSEINQVRKGGCKSPINTSPTIAITNVKSVSYYAYYVDPNKSPLTKCTVWLLIVGVALWKFYFYNFWKLIFLPCPKFFSITADKNHLINFDAFSMLRCYKMFAKRLSTLIFFLRYTTKLKSILYLEINLKNRSHAPLTCDWARRLGFDCDISINTV